MKKLVLPIIAVSVLVSGNAFAAKREVKIPLKQIPYIQKDDVSSPVIGKKDIVFRYEKDDDWYMSDCGRYAFQYLLDGLKNYSRVEQARIFAQMNEIVCKEAPKIKIGAAHSSYQAKQKVLTIEFKRDEEKRGINYCNLAQFDTQKNCVSGPVCEALKKFDDWSGRQKQVAAEETVEEVEVIDTKSMDEQTARELDAALKNVIGADTLAAPQGSCQ